MSSVKDCATASTLPCTVPYESCDQLNRPSTGFPVHFNQHIFSIVPTSTQLLPHHLANLPSVWLCHGIYPSTPKWSRETTTIGRNTRNGAIGTTFLSRRLRLSPLRATPPPSPTALRFCHWFATTSRHFIGDMTAHSSRSGLTSTVHYTMLSACLTSSSMPTSPMGSSATRAGGHSRMRVSRSHSSRLYMTFGPIFV